MKHYDLVIAVATALSLAVAGNAQGLAIGGHVSTLGVGGDVAFNLAEHVNLRGSINLFQYNRGFIKDGIHYDGTMYFRSVGANVDWFPFRGGFHVSPGVIVYNGNEADLNAVVPSGQTFTLGGTTFTSPSTGLVGTPITGRGSIAFRALAPEIRVGWGNLVAKGERHISIPIELGIVFQGAPTASLHLQGSACDPTGRTCVDASSPIVQSSIQAEVAKVNESISSFKVYPVLSIGIGYRF